MSAFLRKSGPKALAGSANLANLLPTGTIFAFQAIIPSSSNNGKCEVAHRYMTLGLIICCSLACFLSSFTDSFVGENGKLYYGIATLNGLYIFNDDDDDDEKNDKKAGGKSEKDKLTTDDHKNDKKAGGNKWVKYKLTPKDFIHACCSLTLFLVIACSSFDVQRCYFPKPGPNADAIITNLPLAVGLLAGGVFTLFPTKRRGIGYADKPDNGEKKDEKKAGAKKADEESSPMPQAHSQ